jgi:transposase-like protein
MIREKAILFKLNNLNVSDKELFKAFLPSETICPGCGAKRRLYPHGSYTRYMISSINGHRIGQHINIKRVKCQSCKRTHALIPDILIPYSSYTLRFIIHVLRAYLNRKVSVRTLCEHFGISVSTLYVWKHRFREHANLMLATFKQFRELGETSFTVINDIPAMPSLFFAKHDFSFLGNRKQRFLSDGHG